MLVYRITHKNYSASLFGTGISGRWNSDGKKVIYCAESIALAFLENMVRRQGAGFNLDFKIMIVEIPDDLSVTVIHSSGLPNGWRNFRDYSFCQPLGDAWYDEGKTCILKVPSSVLPESNNYVLNPEHPDYIRIKLAGVTNLVPDERIEEILKKYSKK
jgi:RES domain-containing protein